MLLAGGVDRPKAIDVRDPFDNSLVDTVPRRPATSKPRSRQRGGDAPPAG
jgi:hypothetical protein